MENTWIQEIAEYLGGNQPSNGSWIQTIYEQLTSISGSSTFWERRLDTINTQVLSANTVNNILLTGVTASNGGMSMISNNAYVQPLNLGDYIQLDFTFNMITPNVNNQYFELDFIVNGAKYRSQTFLILKNNGVEEYFSCSWGLPVEQDFLDYGGNITIKPTHQITIKDRYLSVARLHLGR
jgi:hypothetical protein